jgi:GH18 family chitinase
MRQKILALSIAGVLASAGIASADPIMMGYYENWDYYATPSYSFDGATAGQNLDLEGKLGAVNAIAYAFLEVGSTGSVYLSDPP